MNQSKSDILKAEKLVFDSKANYPEPEQDKLNFKNGQTEISYSEYADNIFFCCSEILKAFGLRNFKNNTTVKERNETIIAKSEIIREYAHKFKVKVSSVSRLL